MFNRFATGAAIESLLQGDKFKHDPTIVSIANALSFKSTLEPLNVGNDENSDNRRVAQLWAENMSKETAKFMCENGLSVEDVQAAILAAEAELNEVQEGKPHTY